jgi:CBS domain containing-hemolysin-like protein
MTSPVLVAVAVILVGVGGMAAAADAALSRISRVRAEELVREGRRGGGQLRRVVADSARYLNVMLLLRVVAEMTAAVMVTVVCLRIFAENWQAILVASAVMVVVSYVVIGVSPRTVGRQHREAVGLISAGPVVRLTQVLGPVPRLLIGVGNALTPGKGFPEGPWASEAELRDLVDLAQQNAVIEQGERQMIHSVFELGDTIVRELMVPRTDMVSIERTKTLRQALSLAFRSGFSRIPVVGDSSDDVVGILYLKDVARRTHEWRDSESLERVESLMRPATFVPESKPAGELLREMQAQQIHLAVVVDEYGGTAGLITIEDVLEEIVGDIADEYDNEHPSVERLSDGSARVSARLNVAELGELFDVDLADIADDDVDTVGGLLAAAIGRVPIAGSTGVVGGLRLVAESTQGRRNRIGTVVVHRAETDSEPLALLPATDTPADA